MPNLPDVSVPLRDALAIVHAADEADRGLAPADLANLRRVVAAGDEGSLVAFAQGLRDSARAGIREALLDRGRALERAAVEAAAERSAWALERKVRSIAGLDRG